MLLRRLSLCALIACGSVGCASSLVSRAPRAVPRATLTIATYNVNFAIPDDPSTVAAVQSLDVDVILLQETNAEWERSLEAWIAQRGLHSRFWRSSQWPAGGAGVISRWPISEEQSVDSAVGWFQAHRFNVRSPRGVISLVNVHLQPPITEGSPVRGWFDAPRQHEREIEHALRTMGDTHARATVIAGDFNEPEGRGAVAWLNRERALCSALPGFAPDATTWRWNVGPIELTERLDHIAYSPRELEAIDVRVLHVGRSDHLPVRAVFRWRR